MNAGDREMLIQMRAEQKAMAEKVDGMATDMHAIRKNLNDDYVRKDVFEAAVRPIIRVFWAMATAIAVGLVVGGVVLVKK